MPDIDNPNMGHEADPSLSTSMRGYIVPVFFDLLFIISWIMIVVRAGAASGNGWCNCFTKVLLFFQSFFGFLCLHSIAQSWAIVLMVFPIVGFWALSRGNKSMLLGYVRRRCFP